MSDSPKTTADDPVEVLRKAITDLIPHIRYLGSIAKHEGQDGGTTQRALDIAYAALRATNNVEGSQGNG